MRGIKLLVSTTVLLAGLALAPAAHSQIVVEVGVQPVCPYGYYGYAPYQCAPMGYYGSGYFYNGIFLGMGPWAGWGYGHGWGGHRFHGDGGGRYHGGAGRVAYNGRSGGGREVRGGGGAAANRGIAHPAGRISPPAERVKVPHIIPTCSTPRTGGSHAPHASAPRASAPRGGGKPHDGGDPQK